MILHRQTHFGNIAFQIHALQAHNFIAVQLVLLDDSHIVTVPNEMLSQANASTTTTGNMIQDASPRAKTNAELLTPAIGLLRIPDGKQQMV